MYALIFDKMTLLYIASVALLLLIRSWPPRVRGPARAAPGLVPGAPLAAKLASRESL